MAEGKAFEEILQEMREVREQQAEKERVEDAGRKAVQRPCTGWLAPGEPQELRWQHPTLGELRFVRAPAKVWVVTCSNALDGYEQQDSYMAVAATLAAAQAWVAKEVWERREERLGPWQNDKGVRWFALDSKGNRWDVYEDEVQA